MPAPHGAGTPTTTDGIGRSAWCRWRRAVSQSDPAAHAALAFVDADLKRNAFSRELLLGTDRTCRFVAEEIRRTRLLGLTEPLVHVAVHGQDPKTREAAVEALAAVGDPRTGHALGPHLGNERAVEIGRASCRERV